MSETRKRRKWLWWLIGGLGGLVLLVILGKYWLIPMAIRSSADSALAGNWRGQIEISDIDFNYFGPVTVGGVTLKDDQGRTWVTVDEAMADWTFLGILSPAVSEIRVEQPHLQMYLKDGKVDWPTIPKEKEEPEPMERIWPEGLERVEVNGFRVTVHPEQGEPRKVHPSNLSMVREGDTVATNFKVVNLPEDQRVELTGGFGALDNQADMKLHLHRRLPDPWSRLIFSLLEVPVLRSASGLVSTRTEQGQEVAITGDLLDSSALSVVGQIRLEDWALATRHAPLFTDLRTDIELSETTASGGAKVRVIDLTDSKAGIGGGELTFQDVRVELTRQWGFRSARALAGGQGRVKHFTDAFGMDPHDGAFMFTSSVTQETTGPEGLAGNLAMRLDDTQVAGFPILSAVMKQLDAAEFNPLALSDILGEMRLDYPWITVEKFRVASKLYALEFRQGGRLNMDTGQIDKLMVVAVPLQKVGGLLDRIPGFEAISNLPVDLTKNLVQMEVSGNWMTRDVTVRPAATQAARGIAWDFFKQAADSGGNLFELTGEALEGGQ
jgi:hypothetical protein